MAGIYLLIYLILTQANASWRNDLSVCTITPMWKNVQKENYKCIRLTLFNKALISTVVESWSLNIKRVKAVATFSPFFSTENVSVIFKLYCLSVMTLVAATYTVALRYTRTISSGDLYFSTTAVCITEVIKLILSLGMLAK